MKPLFFHVFYSKRSFYKRFSLLFVVWVAVLAGAGWGCSGTNPAVTGGINLPAPTADLEGGSAAALRVLCGTSATAPQGSIVQITNINDATIPVVRSPLDANNSYSLQTCLQVQQTLEIQIFDQALTPLSAIQTVTRTGTEPAGICPTPSNTAPTCP